MRGLLAHQGEELLIPAAIVALVLLVPMIRQRLGRHPDVTASDPAVCSYCGEAVGSQDERCSACGFRVRR